MEKLDRLGWTAGIAFISHGARLGVRVNDPTVLEGVVDRLPPGWKRSASPVVDVLYSLVLGGGDPSSRVRRFHLLYAGSARVARTLQLDEALDTLQSRLHFDVALRARPELFVHAGVVGWRGKAIVCPGTTTSGKTTLIAALIQAGADYYSDEYAVLDSRGRVHPYPKTLSLRGCGTRQPTPCRAKDLGAQVGRESLPVGLVVATRYRTGARWRPRRLSPGEALLELLANTVLARTRSEAALRILRRAVEGAAGLKGVRGEARELIASLLHHGGEAFYPGLQSSAGIREKPLASSYSS